MILFCLPYAGGSEAMYYGWKKYLDPGIELEAVELKGRGKRYGENFYKDLDDAVEDIYSNIKDKIMYNEYAFFGHSMGRFSYLNCTTGYVKITLKSLYICFFLVRMPPV